MRIGILQTGHAPDEIKGALGDYADMFKRLFAGNDFTFDQYDVVDGTFPTNAAAADGWLITGSRHGVYEDHDWLAPLEALIREITASGAPLIGICFGHQVIAQALGGKVEKFRGGWSVGRKTYDFGDEKLALNAWHQDQVVELPPGAQIIASNDFCQNAAMVIGDNVLTIQPHPEFGAEMMAGLIEYRGSALPEAVVQGARETLNHPTANQELADRMAAFFRKGAK